MKTMSEGSATMNGVNDNKDTDSKINENESKEPKKQHLNGDTNDTNVEKLDSMKDKAKDEPSAKRIRLDAPFLQQSHILSYITQSNDPAAALDDIQAAHAVKIPHLAPAFALLDLMGIRRGDIYRNLLGRLLGNLVQRIPQLPPETLTDLLEKTLPYMQIPELEKLPMKLLQAHPNPPAHILESLSTLGPLITKELPPKIAQRMWESNIGAFIDHMNPLIDEYLSKLVHHPHFNAFMQPQSRLKDRRKHNEPLRMIVATLGGSYFLYHQLILQIRWRYDKTKDNRLCELRSDVLMMLHDAGAEGIWNKEICHHFAWYLDAYVNLMNQTPDEKKIVMGEIVRKLNGAMNEYYKVLHGKEQKNKLSGLNVKGSFSNALQHELIQILAKLEKADKKQTFLIPVLQSFPDLMNHTGAKYKTVIRTPMDTTTIRRKMGEKQYKNIKDFQQDCYLIYQNSLTFWGEKSDVTKTARRIFFKRAGDLCSQSAEKMDKIAKMEAEAKRVSNKAAEAAEKAKKAAPSGMLKDRAMRLIAASDAKMIIASRVASDALIRGLWYTLKLEAIEKQLLPRDADTVKRIAYFLEQGEYAYECVTISRQGEKPQGKQLSKSMEREILPMLALIAYDNATLNAQEIERLTQLCRKSPIAHQATRIRFVTLLQRKQGVELATVLIDILSELIDATATFDNLGFYLSTMSALESSAHTQATATLKPWQDLTLKLLNNILLPSFNLALKNAKTPMEIFPLKLSMIAARITLHQLKLNAIPEGEALPLVTCTIQALGKGEPMLSEDSDEFSERVCKLYLSGTFATARSAYEELFKQAPSWRRKFKLPTADEVTRRQIKTVTPLPSPSPSPSPMSSPSLSPSPSPSPSTPGFQSSSFNRPEREDDSGGSEEDSDDDMFKPSPKR